jgi:ketosteroid isomerase-like protein
VFEQRVEFLRSAYDIFNRGEVEPWLALHDDSVVFDLSGGQFYDLDPVYRGHDGIRAFWDAAHEPFGTFLLEPVDFEEGNDGVLVKLVMRVRGAGSGAPAQRRLFHAWRFRGGLLWHLEQHGDEEKARRAVGLGEPATGHYPKPGPDRP